MNGSILLNMLTIFTYNTSRRKYSHCNTNLQLYTCTYS